MEILPDIFLVGYGDDIVAVIVAQNTVHEQRNLNQVIQQACSWLKEHDLDLATEKREIVLLTWRRIPTIILVQVGAEAILTKKTIKYLGVG